MAMSVCTNLLAVGLFLGSLQSFLEATPVPQNTTAASWDFRSHIRSRIRGQAQTLLKNVTNFKGSLPPLRDQPSVGGLQWPGQGPRLTCEVLRQLGCLSRNLSVTRLEPNHSLNEGVRKLHQWTRSLMQRRLESCDVTEVIVPTEHAQQLVTVVNLLRLYESWMDNRIPFACGQMQQSTTTSSPMNG